MDAIKHLLIGTDFSAASEQAIAAGAALAQRYGARVTLVHVFDPAVMLPAPAVEIPSARGLADDLGLEATLSAELDRLAEQRLAGIEETSTELLQSPSAADALCAYARERGADLLCVATHGRTGVENLLLGSVAEKVVRHAPCSVLVVRPSTRVN